MRKVVERLQPIGRALMLPIAVLPIAGLLLRLGQPDLLDLPFVAAAGNAIFSHLGLLFAIGVAVGLARENHGAAGLAGVVCYLVAIEGAKVLIVPPGDMTAAAADAWRTSAIAKLTTPTGIIAGLVSGWLYNRYATIQAPAFLSFFAGRRFVPIVAGGAGLIGALALGYGFHALQFGFDALSRLVVGSGPIGLFLYGVLNRLLIVTGLHHILNNIAWFILGDFHGATGDLKRFFAGDPTAGSFMSGFFPVMMFGLPAACLAFYRTALPERRASMGGLLLSLGLTSMLTGVTEPIEFGFMFLAPGLYALHALLTGVAMVVMNALGVKLGFGFSAGLIDYTLNFGLATRPLLLLPVGAAYAIIYYFAFTFAIRHFNLATPGREPLDEALRVPVKEGERGSAFVAALGGPANLASVDACTTRLRLSVNDQEKVDERALRALGARGLLRPGGGALQVVLGPIADAVASEIRSAARVDAPAPSDPTATPLQGWTIDATTAPFVAGLGGEANVVGILRCGNRLICDVRDPRRVDARQFPDGVRAVVWPAKTTIHLLFAP